MKIYLNALDQTLEQMKNHTERWSKELNQARQLVLLEGPMGAGKTQVVKWTLDFLGVEEVASPTYAIHHQYKSKIGVVDHIDLYRLKDEEDLESTGFWDLFSQKQTTVFVEWSDKIPSDQYPRWPTWKITIGFGKQSHLRSIKIEKV